MFLRNAAAKLTRPLVQTATQTRLLSFRASSSRPYSNFFRNQAKCGDGSCASNFNNMNMGGSDPWKTHRDFEKFWYKQYKYNHYNHHRHCKRRTRIFPLLVAGAIGAGIYHWMTKHNRIVSADAAFAPSSGGNNNNNENEKKNLGAQPRLFSFADAVDKVMPSVVHIIAESHGVWSERQSHGSGFIISEDGLVITNAHVVSGNPDQILVQVQSGRVLEAELVNCDELSDVALVRVKTTEKLPVADLGDSDLLRVGDWVIAVGSPLNLANTVTAGIVSAVKRSDVEIGLNRHMHYVQTDAAIVQGNSGGPLVDAAGNVVAINTMTVANAQGFSFAIPINTAKEILDIWKTHGVIKRPFIGIRMTTVESVKNFDRSDLQLPALPKVDSGVIVVHVFPDSPAAKSGLRSGDVIVKINGKDVKETRDIVTSLGITAGKTCEIVAKRNEKGRDKELSFKVTSVPVK